MKTKKEISKNIHKEIPKYILYTVELRGITLRWYNDLKKIPNTLNFGRAIFKNRGLTPRMINTLLSRPQIIYTFLSENFTIIKKDESILGEKKYG